MAFRSINKLNKIFLIEVIVPVGKKSAGVTCNGGVFYIKLELQKLKLNKKSEIRFSLLFLNKFRYFVHLLLDCFSALLEAIFISNLEVVIYVCTCKKNLFTFLQKYFGKSIPQLKQFILISLGSVTV